MLDGTWILTAATLNGAALTDDKLPQTKLIVAADTYLTFVNGQRDAGRTAINTTVTPHVLEITGVEGPNQGRTIHAIFARHGDELQVCYSFDGKPPTEFKAAAGSTHALMTYQPLLRVTGLGGVFFKAKDAPKLREWYRVHFGLNIHPSYGGTSFRWREDDAPEKMGETVWSIFDGVTKYFAPSDASFMLNYRVADIDAVLEQLRAEGVWIDDKREDSEYGRFAWILDGEGNRIELWEPPAGGVCP